MTREEIERDYNVVNGTIKSPGKFEGEPVWAPYFWDAGLNGVFDSDEDGVYGFEVNRMSPRSPSWKPWSGWSWRRTSRGLCTRGAGVGIDS